MEKVPQIRSGRSRKTTTATKVAAVRESRVVLFGSRSDIEVQQSIRRAEISGRKTDVIARPSFDTGTGPCGTHLCSCKEVCKLEYAKSTGAYPGDQGAAMGVSF